MKRVIYVSSKADTLTEHDLEDISEISRRNNAELGITGLLISAHRYFFQFLEGGESAVEQLLKRIQQDPRHNHFLILKVEENLESRMFPEWSMRIIDLDEMNNAILDPIRIMLENITQSHRIIERYTQPSIIKFITEGVNPLDIPIRKTEKIVLFGDMVGFSYLSENFPVEEVAEVVNEFLEVCSQEIVDQGGEVTKYIGDCVMAHFTPDQGDNAIGTCLNLARKLRVIRESAGRCRLSRFLYCGFGLSMGMVIQGNIGSSIKLDYTVLGDAVNIAARLESLTRELRRMIALTAPVKLAARKNWFFENVGDFKFKGQEKKMPVYSVLHPDTADFPDHQQLVMAMRRLRVNNGSW
ncbi:BLUF domain-containing protein [Methylococcus mesophilus]|uniref:BLUF domain-containing protein n=1 Tax=Methylococcus mesophilus TaxID=2993564 RepID=UPI00224B360E|nr:BLUF domain-containing protein [Methylococcus mesophilus]UZR28963.1 BLUF domain-containing protein [Methylococcus mesophilus]